MMGRCYNQNTPAFRLYGGRGISVCPRWHAFENFLADMGHRPEGMSLDRIDPDGHYEPSNCRWATASEQNRNKRTNVRVQHDGESVSLVELAERIGQPYSRIRERRARGCTGDALTGPKRTNQWG